MDEQFLQVKVKQVWREKGWRKHLKVIEYILIWGLEQRKERKKNKKEGEKRERERKGKKKCLKKKKKKNAIKKEKAKKIEKN